MKGNGTSLISLCIGSGSQLLLTQKMLVTELGTASNIKSRTNRQSVQSGIKAAQQKLKLYKQTPENGLAVFCGCVINEEGKEKMISFAFEPPKIMKRGLYYCDSIFHIELLNEMLLDSPKYGFIILNGNGCLFASVQGDQKKILTKYTVNLPKKHNKGGQSAQRYGRIRLESRHQYLKKCAELSVSHFINENVCNVKGIILAGSSEFKNTFATLDFLDQRLREKIINIIDIEYGMERGLHTAIEQSAEKMESIELIDEQHIISEFMNEISTDSGKFSIGYQETNHALEIGAVKNLILWEHLDLHRIVIQKEKKETLFVKKNEIINILKESEIVENDLFIDWITENNQYGCDVNIVTDRTSHGMQFVKGFNGIGAILRWNVEFDQYDEEYDDIAY